LTCSAGDVDTARRAAVVGGADACGAGETPGAGEVDGGKADAGSTGGRGASDDGAGLTGWFGTVAGLLTVNTTASAHDTVPMAARRFRKPKSAMPPSTTPTMAPSMLTALRTGTAEHMTPTMPRSSDAHASPTNPGRGSVTVALE
jgi:hypothetical protein